MRLPSSAPRARAGVTAMVGRTAAPPRIRAPPWWGGRAGPPDPGAARDRSAGGNELPV